MCRWCGVGEGCSCRQARQLFVWEMRNWIAVEAWADGVPGEDLTFLRRQVEEARAEFEATEEQQLAAEAWISRLPKGAPRLAREKRLAAAKVRAARNVRDGSGV